MRWEFVSDEDVVAASNRDEPVPLWRLAQVVARLGAGEDHRTVPCETWLPPDDWYELEAARLRERAPA